MIGTTLYAAASRGDKWNSYIIDGETRASWLVEGEKIAKRTLKSHVRQFYTAEQRAQLDADRAYVARMEPRLRRLITCADAAQLRAYAAKLGITEEATAHAIREHAE